MLRKLYQWLCGYLCIRLCGTQPERFLNLCSSKEIYLWGMENKDNQYECYICLKDYKKLKSIAKKSGVVPYINQRFGFPFFRQHSKKRKAYFLGIMLFIGIVYILSCYIWNISIEGSYKHTEEQLIAFLEKINVSCGKKIKDIDCQLIEEYMRKEYTDIGWVSAEIKGTRLIIRINETVNALTKEQLKETNLPYADIVAKKDGLITSIITRKGTPKVKKGDIVKKGDVLISGVIPVIGDNDILMKNEVVVADGDIFNKTVYSYKDSFPLKYILKIPTGESKMGLELSFFNKKIFSYSPRNSYTECDIITEVSNLKLLKNFYLPIQYTSITLVEYEKKEAIYTAEEAKVLANRRLLRYIENLSKQGSSILDKDISIIVKDGKCTVNGKIIVEEESWEYRKIPDSDWRNVEADEHNGNDD